MQHPEVVVRKRIRVVDTQRKLVVALRLIELPALQQHVAKIYDRRHAVVVQDESCAKIALGGLHISQAQETNASLRVRMCGLVTFDDRYGKELFGARKIPALESDHRFLKAIRRHKSCCRGRRIVPFEVAMLMRVDVVTLFPQFFEPIVNGSILGRAQAKGLVRIEVHDLWKYVPPGERADDAPYGGGPGMVMRLGPLIACMEELLGPDLGVPSDWRIVVPAPAGQRFNHAVAERLAEIERVVFVCGHYEGIDERFFQLVDAQELSLGDFVLTGGEIAVLAFLDACVRLLPGVISDESARDDSFAAGSLDWPHFTRPAVFRGISVPEVLLSGDHQRVEEWRKQQASRRTSVRRPDLLLDR